MTREERTLQVALLALLIVHAGGFLLWPGPLWGVSHLAAWPTTIGLLWLALAIAGLALVPRAEPWLERLPLPGKRGIWLLLLVAIVLFVVLRESQHLFGDGWLLIRSRGMSVTFLRAPVLVRSTVWVVRTVEDTFGVGIATGIAALSILAGLISVFMMVRLANVLSNKPAERWLLLGSLITAGAMQLYFGHVEYYGMLAAGCLVWLWVALRELREEQSPWMSWIAYAALLTLHLSALGLFAAQFFLGVRAWRRGQRRQTVGAVLAALAVFLLLLRLARSGAQVLASQAGGGIRNYLSPYFDTESTRHAFGFFDPAHALAVGNDLLLSAPVVFAMLVVVLVVRRDRTHPARLFLALAGAGSLAINVLFNREIGPVRDWDTLAPYAFVYLCWGAVEMSLRGRIRPGVAALCVAWVGLMHTIPWTLVNAIPGAGERQMRLLLTEPSLWSPYARGYLHEEFAIVARQAGDLPTTLREYEAASAASPSDARYHVGRGDTHYRLGNVPAATDAYEAAIRVRPSWMTAHNNLAAVLLASGGDLERAQLHAREAVRLAPNNSEAWITLGDVVLARGQAAAAVQAFEAALRLQPRSQRVAQRLQVAKQRRDASAR